jgi:hypothetical protein
VFDPSRHLGENPELDPNLYVWGFGRRRCPGIELAKSIVLHTMTVVLSVFDIAKAKDANGVEITPEAKFKPGTVR